MKTPEVELDIVYHTAAEQDDRQRFERAAEWVAREEGFERLSASIAVVDDETIHELNRRHLDHDWPTDVISFVFERTPLYVDGEIITSWETAVAVSSRAEWSARNECLLYVVHGLLHLAGLDDQTPEDRRQMRVRERDCLLALGVEQAAEHVERWQQVL